MADDYYMQWLGLSPGTRPPDHYVLLALPRFVNSLHAIEAAAEAQRAKLTPHTTQPDQELAAAATAMMNDIATARTVLSDPAQRKAYDIGLAGKLGFDDLPSSDAPDMADTNIGTPPSGSDRSELANLTDDEQNALAVLGHMADDESDVPDTFLEGQTPLQEIDDGLRARSSNVAIPFWMICALAGFGMLLVAGIVTVCVMWLDPEPVPVSALPAPPPPPPKAFEFVEHFSDSELGIAYRVRAAGEGPNFGVKGGFLWLGSADRSSVRIDVTPRQEEVLFRQVTVKARMEKGASFGVGIARAAMLTITSSKDGLKIHAEPGQPVAVPGPGGWPILPHAAEISIELVRNEGSVDWQVNGQTVAISPDIKPRTVPSLVLTSSGTAGRRVGIDYLHVMYGPQDIPR